MAAASPVIFRSLFREPLGRAVERVQKLADGSINQTDDPLVVRVDINTDTGLASAQAHALAAVLFECADQLDRWTGTGTN